MAKTNYSKMSTKPKKEEEVVEEVVKDSIEIEQSTTEVTEPDPLPTGIVSGCSKLNVRKKPLATAEIIGTLDSGTTVTIYDEVGEFYKIGPTNEFCMKKYISVNK